MKVLLICHKDLIPPRKVVNLDVAEYAPWRTEYYTALALKRLKHTVAYCGLNDSLVPLRRALKKFKPDVAFNLLEEFSGEGLLEHFVVGYLEELGQPVTGNSSLGLILSKNKLAAKALLLAHGIPVPRNRRYPKIVKFLDEESSRGIQDSSIVHSKAEERRQIKNIMKSHEGRIFTEEYIPGRELHVAVFRRDSQFIAAPIWETTFGEKPGAKIISEKVKWDFDYRHQIGVELKLAENLSANLIREIQEIAIRSCRALELDSYARVDIRLTPSNETYVLEVNPNPDIAEFDEFAECVKSGGTDYEALIEGILQEGLKRNSQSNKPEK